MKIVKNNITIEISDDILVCTKFVDKLHRLIVKHDGTTKDASKKMTNICKLSDDMFADMARIQAENLNED